jgi:hypothetical protein
MNNLRASLVLTFQDKLTAGLTKVREQLDGLKKVGRELAMPGLAQATEGLRQATAAAGGLGRALHTVAGAAKSALGHLGRMGANLERLGKKVGPIGALVGFGTIKETTAAYAEYDAVLRQIAITEGRSGGGQATRLVGRLGGRLDRLALGTGQSSTDLAETYKWIITTHPGETATAARAMANQMIGALAKAATAYHLDVTDLKNVPFALESGFGLKGNQMEAGLAILHRAAMQAHFTMGAFDQELPGLAAQFGSFGTKGLAGLRAVAAMLETVVKVVPSATPSMAGTDLGDLLTYVTGPSGQARMAMTSRGFSGKMYAQTRALLARAGITHGFDASGIIHAGALHGVDPVNSILNYLHTKLQAIPKNITGRDRATLEGEVINALISNHQAAQAARAILLHWNEYHRTQGAVHGAGAATLDRNFITMTQSPSMQLKIMAEGIRQVGRALGQGFMPVIRAVNFGLLGLVHFLTWANATFPRTTAWVLGLAGAGIALVAALGVLGMVAPAVAVGFELLLGLMGGLAAAASLLASPFVAAAIVIGGAADDIYEHWSRFRPFFVQLGHGVMEVLDGIGTLLKGIFLFDWRPAVKGIEQIGRGLVDGFMGAIKIVKTLLLDLIKWLMGKIGADIEHALMAPFDAIERVLAPSRAASTGTETSGAGGADGGMSYLMPQLRPSAAAAGHVTVGVDPHNGKIRITHASPPSVVRIRSDMGDMLTPGGS